jgi:hypothetical protein
MVGQKQFVFIHMLIFTLCALFAQSTFAATSVFDINTLVGSDTVAPTVPAGLTATGVATTQIDLSWSTSTDNVIVSGYHVWREDVPTGTSTASVLIATTTFPFYSDTGLVASTSYQYYVTAFDSVFNESASSSSVIGTTLSIVPTTTPTSTSSESRTTYGSRGKLLQDQIVSIEVLPQRDSVLIRFKTTGYIRSVIKWGETGAYELGSIAEGAFSKTHETKIVGLTPGKRYSFTLEGENTSGTYGSMYQGTFTTQAPVDIFPPQNVSGLRAVRDGNDIVLSWSNPSDPDLTKIRVVRSDRFYPNDVADGWVVYEGEGETVRDSGSALTAPKQFYTVFAYDELGNISSGAVVAIHISGTESAIVDPTQNTIALRFTDIKFFQEGISLSTEGGSVLVDGTKQITLSIPYETLPEHLKTILVTLHHPDNAEETFDFILRVNRDKTAFEGILAPLGISGIFKIQVSVFDFVTTQVGYTDGSLISHIAPNHGSASPEPHSLASETKKISMILGLLALIILGARFSLRMFAHDKR